MLRLRVPAHVARLLAATPSLRLSWLGGVAAALAFTVLSAHNANDPHAGAMFLLLAPILPVTGVAVSYGPLFDPAADVALAAPTDGFRVLLLRAFAVVSATTVLTGMAVMHGAPTARSRNPLSPHPAPCGSRAGVFPAQGPARSLGSAPVDGTSFPS